MLGKLFASLRTAGLYNGALIAVMSDHGEAFGEHGERTHGVFLYDETIRVPLLIKLPETGAPAPPTGKSQSTTTHATSGHPVGGDKIDGDKIGGRTINDRVALVDVMPTILESADIAVPKAVQGQSLIPLMRSSKTDVAAPERGIYSETDYPFLKFHWSALRSLRTGKYLYVESPKRELYEETSDPKAANNLALNSPAIAGTLNAQTEAFRRSTASDAVNTAKPDPQQAAKLSALGYIGSDAGAKAEAAVGGVDPKDHIESANLFHDGLIDLEEKRYPKAVSELEQVAEKEPESGFAYSELSTAWIRLKNFEKALPVLRKAVELRPENGLKQYELGQALLQTGNLKESVAHFEKAVQLMPTADYHFALATIYVRTGQDNEALQQIDQALQIDPSHYRANLLRGIVLAEDRPAEALPNLQTAARENPNAIEPHAFMAKAYERLGNTTKAEEERQIAKELGGHP
jgi:tetratricopeptide (TPR) repeat protein